jgi:hypothetical protein
MDNLIDRLMDEQYTGPKPTSKSSKKSVSFDDSVIDIDYHMKYYIHEVVYNKKVSLRTI